MTAPSGVLVADREPLFASVLSHALSREPHLRPVGHASDVPALLELARSSDVDVVLVDSELPDAIGACRRLRQDRPDLKILVVAPGQDHHTLVEALETGANGLVAKDGRLRDLVASVGAVLRGEASVPRRMLGGLLHELIQRKRQDGAAVERYAKLSRREREVLALLAAGHDHDGIARRLVISPQTARTHIQNVMAKLDVHSRVEAAAFAVDNGFADGFAEDAR